MTQYHPPTHKELQRNIKSELLWCTSTSPSSKCYPHVIDCLFVFIIFVKLSFIQPDDANEKPGWQKVRLMKNWKNNYSGMMHEMDN